MSSATAEPKATPRRDARPSTGRRIAVWVLIVLACLATVLALMVGYARRAVFDSDQFANRATAALSDESVRSLIGEQVTDQLVLKNESDLIAGRPLIESVVSSVVGGGAFTGAFRAGVRDVHRAVFDGDQHTVTLALGDVGTMVAAGLEAVQPSLARRVEATRRVEVLRRDIGEVNATAARTADTIRLLAPLLLLVAILCAAGALWLSADRRRTVVRLAVGAAVGGLLLIVAYDVARSLAVGQVGGPEARAAVGAVWDAFLEDLHTAAWILAGSGAVVAAAAASLIRPVELDAPLRRAGAWLTREPARPALRVLRAVGLVAVGFVFLLARDAVLHLLFAVVGLYLIFAGVSAILWLVYQPRPAGEAGKPQDAGAPSRGRRPRLVAPVLAGVLIAGAIVAFVGTGGATTAAPAAGPCNGQAALCDRSLPEVATAATHNSMSVPLPGWFSSEQDAAIAEQLRFGIRGLLIDTHYADRLDDGKLRTFVGDPKELRAQAQQDGVSPGAIDSALRLRERLGFKGEGERGMYLCHSFCELGGTRLEDALHDLHDFLIANPGEVVVVINQDYVTPEDFVGAVEDAGLDKLAYRGPITGHWPTLRQMIDSGQRVVILAENHAGAAPWYHLAYDTVTEETPYAFSQAVQLTDPSQTAKTCRPNRGPAEAPMFLVNHWITTDPVPLPSNADKVNAYGPLMRRLRECQRIRHHIPNLVAVNFYRRGDLLRAVDTLNGVERTTQ
jgi:hypothetical protein